ncbi:leucine-rich repeat domain-containing protein [Aquimarina longa]|uniref:leucine-rich repeat domain-containing protein n=1 Tax=Aquimarina longa TaxID=1080221 RepID=UPI00078241EA|nr:leucine-rich repeat domain-containing protein [Aquimarina longa]
MGKRPYYKSSGLGGFFIVILIVLVGLIGYFLSNYGFLLIPIFLGFYLFFKYSDRKTENKPIEEKLTTINTDNDYKWWNNLNSKWKKIFNLYIDKPERVFTENWMTSDISHFITSKGTTQRPSKVELNEILNLKKLSLTGLQIQSIEVLRPLNNLKELYLSQNQISDLNPLKDLTNLTSLSLHGNQLTDISQINNLRNLETLHLFDNKISKIDSLKYLQKLKKLDLENNPIEKKDIEELQKVIPNCKIYF